MDNKPIYIHFCSMPGCTIIKKSAYTREEVAEFLGCSIKTFTRRLKEWNIEAHGKKLSFEQFEECLKQVGIYSYEINI